jgi:hypothetical protein
MKDKKQVLGVARDNFKAGEYMWWNPVNGEFTRRKPRINVKAKPR